MDKRPARAPRSFASLNDFMAEYGSKKTVIAEKLGISRFQLNGLLLEEGSQPPAAIFDVREPLAETVGALIGQSAEYVRDYYLRKAAA